MVCSLERKRGDKVAIGPRRVKVCCRHFSPAGLDLAGRGVAGRAQIDLAAPLRDRPQPRYIA